MPVDRIAFRKTPDSPHDTDAWYASAFQVFYDGGGEPTVEYIELSSDSRYRVAYQSMDVFGLAADELVERIAAGAPLGAWDGYSCIFPSLELALWRPTPDEPRFATIGIGIRGVLRRRPRDDPVTADFEFRC